jgi:outer membrane biosynthesis protein TonB
MKRCPQCEFIYEDDQSLCDMDGVLLVFDSRTLPNVHALATVSGPMPEKGQRRSRMVPAFASVILMLVIASVYYVTALRPTASEFSPATVTSAQPEPPAPVTEAPAVVPEPTPEANEAQPPAPVPAEKRETRTASSPKPAAAPARRAVTQPATTTATPEPKKDDSKVGSILKKTGRILKKPFKF